MNKRSAFFLAILLAAGIAQVKVPPAAAQLSGASDSSCSSGVTSIDGTCIGQDQSLGTTSQQTTSPANSMGSSISGASIPLTSLSQQYPGLGLDQSLGMNGRVPFFNDRSSPTSIQAEEQALFEAQALALQQREPPTDFQRLVRASLGKLLPVYGDSLFLEVPTTFFPLRETQVTPDYVIGPGDQLIVRIWGQVNFNSQLTVDRSGSVYLPQVGEIHVAGLPYSQLQQHLHDQVARIYRNFNLSVELGQLRSIQVFVVGQARRPGTYTLSSLSTLVTALFSTGGPSVQGSLRNIQLMRGGQTIVHFDLYDLLLKGDKSKDVSLLPGDVIYIPPVGPQAAVGGNVRNPAIYELKGETTVDQAIQFAGGLSATASVQRASLERIDAHKDRTVADISLSQTGGQAPLKEGDILRILPISPEFQDTVTLRGNVAEPGRFSWHPGMKLSDIIPDSKALITRDYWERRNQLGIPGPEFKPEYVTNPDLYQRRPEENASGPASGPASVPSPGNLALPASSGTQGLNPAGSNLNPNQISSTQEPGALTLQGLAQQNSQANSQGTQNAQPQGGTNSALSNEGQLQWRGTLPRPPLNITLPVPEIDWSYAVIERMNPQTLTTSLVPFNPGKLVLDHDPSQDLPLEPGDVITVFSQADIRVPQAQRTKYVRLEGEFRQAGIYSVQPGETLRHLVERAGGLTPDAYLFGSSFTRESTRAIQQLRLDDYIQSLQLDIDRATISAAANGFGADVSGAAASRSIVSRLQGVRATGRIVLNMPPNATNVDSLPDLALEDGDTFTVPSRPLTVNVVGSVYDQNSFIFQTNRTVGGYLQLAGGPTRSADRNEAFIIRADGSVVSRRSQNGVFGNTFASARLNPGDTLVVPEKVPKPSFMRSFQTYSQLFSSLAFGVAAISVLQ